MAGIELGIFFVVFLAACAASRPTFDQLFLRWRGGWRPFLRGAGYSIALRVGLAVILIAVILIASSVTQIQKSTVEQLRPNIEAVVDPKALQRDPLYFALMITLISFVVAGFREELWRAGMLAGFRALFPAHYARRFGPASAVAFAAVVFGLGHAPQGISAIGLTMLLGVGLGAIILWHSSIWDAAIAHGFFDATTFLFLWILANYSHLLPA